MNYNTGTYVDDSARREEILRAEEVLKRYRSKMGTSTTTSTTEQPLTSKPGMMGSIANAGQKIKNEAIYAGEKLKQSVTHTRPEVSAGDRTFQHDISTDMPSNRGVREQNFQQPGFTGGAQQSGFTGGVKQSGFTGGSQQREFVDSRYQQREFVDNKFQQQGFVDNRTQQQGFVDNRTQQQGFVDNRFQQRTEEPYISRSGNRSASSSSCSSCEEYGMRRSLTPEREGYGARGVGGDVGSLVGMRGVGYGRARPVVMDVNWGQPNQMHQTWDASHGQVGHGFTEKERVSDTSTKKKGLGGMFAGLFKRKEKTHDIHDTHATRRSFDDNFMRREEPFEFVYANALVQRSGPGLSSGFRDEGFIVTLKLFRKNLFNRGLTDDLSIADFLKGRSIALDNVIDYTTRAYLKELLGLGPQDSIKLEAIHDPSMLFNSKQLKPIYGGKDVAYGPYPDPSFFHGHIDRPLGHTEDFHSKDLVRGDEGYHKRGLKEKIKEKIRRPKHEEHVVDKRDEEYYRNDEYVSRDAQHKRGLKEKIKEKMHRKHDIADTRDNQVYPVTGNENVYEGDVHKRGLGEKARDAIAGVKSKFHHGKKEEVYDERITQEDKWKQEGRVVDKGFIGSVPQYESTYVKPGQQMRDERVYGGEHDYRGGNVRKEEKLYGGEHDYRREEPMVGHDEDYERGYGVDNRGKGVGSNFYDRGHRVYNNNDEPVRYQ